MPIIFYMHIQAPAGENESLIIYPRIMHTYVFSALYLPFHISNQWQRSGLFP